MDKMKSRPIRLFHIHTKLAMMALMPTLYSRTFVVFFITARKRSLGQGNIFIGMCQEFCSQGGLPQCMLGCHPPREQTPPQEQTPPSGAEPPVGEREIRSTRGRYASYWNASLLFVF